MEIITEVNGLMGRNKEGEFKSIMKKVIDTKANGKLIYRMVKENLLIKMVLFILDNSKTTLNMVKENLMTYKIRK